MLPTSSYLNKYHNNPALRNEFVRFVSEFVTEDRNALFRKVISQRTRYVTVILENLYQSQNASAVLRSCECMGVQDVHIIENYNTFEVNPEVDMSASKWLSLHFHSKNENNTCEAINSLKNQGYRIIATSPHKNDCYLSDFDVTKGKFALLFGTERRGLTTEAIEMADEFVKIPMVGLIESYNISVSVAICLYDLINRIKKIGVPYSLTPDEQEDILLQWLLLSVREWESIENRFLKVNS